MKSNPSLTLLALCAALAAPVLARAQPPVPAAEQAALDAKVAELDGALFDAYNRCDLKVMGEMVSDDLEFYHDQTGLQVGRAPFVDSLRKNICGKVRRDLTPGTLRVYRLKGFGAVETGAHRFCDARKNARCDANHGGEARFVMIWRDGKDGWKLTRVISFDHRSGPD